MLLFLISCLQDF